MKKKQSGSWYTWDEVRSYVDAYLEHKGRLVEVMAEGLEIFKHAQDEFVLVRIFQKIEFFEMGVIRNIPVFPCAMRLPSGEETASEEHIIIRRLLERYYPKDYKGMRQWDLISELPGIRRATRSRAKKGKPAAK